MAREYAGIDGNLGVARWSIIEGPEPEEWGTTRLNPARKAIARIVVDNTLPEARQRQLARRAGRDPRPRIAEMAGYAMRAARCADPLGSNPPSASHELDRPAAPRTGTCR